MRRRKHIIIVMILALLTSCIPSLSDVTKMEGGPGEGASGVACVSIKEDIMVLPPKPEDRLERELAYEDGSVKMVGPVTYILEFIKIKIDKAVKDIFDEMQNNGWLQTLLTLSFTLFLLFYIAAVLLGLSQANAYDILINIMRILIVFVLATQWGEFSFFVKDIAEGAGRALTDTMSKVFANGYTDLAFIDDLISLLLSIKMMKFLFALMAPDLGPGILYGLGLIMFIWFFVQALLKVLYIMVVAMIFRGLLFGLGPLFLAMAIFSKTRKFFDGWIRQIINFTLLPVILFTFLGFFYGVIQYFIQEVADTAEFADLCYDKAFAMPGNITEWFKLIVSRNGVPVQGENAQIPIDLAPILALVIVAFVLRAMVDWAIALSGSLTQAFTTFRVPGLGGGGSIGETFGFPSSKKNKDGTSLMS